MKTSYDIRYLEQYPEIKHQIHKERIYYDVVRRTKDVVGAAIVSVGILFPTPARAVGNMQALQIPMFEIPKDPQKEQRICGEGSMLFGLIPDPNLFFPEICNPLFQEKDPDIFFGNTKKI